MNNQYIFWDLDGTVVESENIEFKSNMFKYTSDILNLDFNLTPNEFIGHEASNIFKLLLEKNHKEFSEFSSKYDEWYENAVNFIKQNVKEIPPRQNIIQLWNSTNELGIKNVIVTSSREDIAKTYLKNIGLDHLCHHYTCINHIKNPKPDPEPYLYTLNKLSADPKKCIVVEDSISGMKSATQAKLFTIGWINDTVNSNSFPADIATSYLDIDLIEIAFSSANNIIKKP